MQGFNPGQWLQELRKNFTATQQAMLRAGLAAIVIAALGLGGLFAASGRRGGGGGGPNPGPQNFGPVILCPGESRAFVLGPNLSNVTSGPASSNPAVATGAVTNGGGDRDVSDTITVYGHTPGGAVISASAEQWILNFMGSGQANPNHVGNWRTGDVRINVKVINCKKKPKPKATPTAPGLPLEEPALGPDTPTLDRYDHAQPEPTPTVGGAPDALEEIMERQRRQQEQLKKLLDSLPSPTPLTPGPDGQMPDPECDGGTCPGDCSSGCEEDTTCGGECSEPSTPCDGCQPDPCDSPTHTCPDDPAPTPTPEPARPSFFDIFEPITIEPQPTSEIEPDQCLRGGTSGDGACLQPHGQ